MIEKYCAKPFCFDDLAGWFLYILKQVMNSNKPITWFIDIHFTYNNNLYQFFTLSTAFLLSQTNGL
jgi:hypothetical protein